MTDGNLTNEERETLLVEYQACQQHNNSSSSQYWTTVGTFMGFSTALLGAISILSDNASNARWLILWIGLAAIIIALVLKKWLKRVNSIIRCNNYRMREIEGLTHMLKNRTIHWLDHPEEIPKGQNTRINKLRKYYEIPGFKIVPWLYVIVILLWSFIILTAWYPIIKSVICGN